MDIELSDIAYYSSLIISIGLGTHYRSITNEGIKRSYGTGLGLLITYIICGSLIYHTVFIVWGNIILIKCCNPQYLHHLSLLYTWIYLMYLILSLDHEGLGYALWVFQIIALRLVGLSYDLHKNAIKEKHLHKRDLNLKEKSDQTDDINVFDVISYSYYFIGLHKGPYYRWKVFKEHLTTPVVKSSNDIVTEQKIKKAAVYTVLYTIIRFFYPLKLYYEEDFYNNYSAEARYFYNIPLLAMFVFQHMLVMSLCTSVCTEAGFGIYPIMYLAKPGHGPTKPISTDLAKEELYNFRMLKTVYMQKLLFGPRMTDTVKSWDLPTRYWFTQYAYKHTIKAKKNLRNLVAIILWALWWGGPKIQYIIFVFTLWTHIILEDGFIQLFSEDDLSDKNWRHALSIMRVLTLVYLTPCLIIPDQDVVLNYYQSIGWVLHIIIFFVFLIYIYAFKKYSHDTISGIFSGNE